MRLHGGLFWHDSDPDRSILLHRDDPVASFERVDPDSPRVRTSLEFLDGQRRVDVTVQPETIVHLVRRLAMRANADGNAWQQAVKSQLLASAAKWGFSDDGLCNETLGVVLASLGYPLVRFARVRGVVPPPYIPRWAEPVFICPDVRSAARAAFGSRASRRVARELPTSLIGESIGAPHEDGSAPARRSMSLVPLALAMALPDGASADVIANVLSASTANHAPQHWPSVDDLELLRRGLRSVGADPAARLCREAMATIDGPGRLLALMVHVPRSLSAHDGPCPRRFADLEAAVAEFTRPVVEVRPRVAAHRNGAAIDLPVAPLNAPAPRRHVERREEFRYPDSVMRLHGAASGGHSLWLPRSRDELRGWAGELHNCMFDYGDCVAGNQCVVLGLRRGDRLVAGVELTCDLRRVRQFVADQNARPRLAERNALRDILGHLGVAGG